jgi:hypothetical protein
MNDAKILGEGNRSRRFDPLLAETINKNFEIESRIKSRKLPSGADVDDSKSSDNASRVTSNSVMDKKPAASGSYNTHDGWCSYFSSLGKDVVMASMSDYYLAGKFGSPRLVQNIKSNLRSNFILTDDNNYYSNQSLEGFIKYHPGYPHLSSAGKIVLIPAYEKPFPIIDLQDGEFEYVRSLFRTDDSRDKVIDVLSRLSGCGFEKISIRTPGQYARKVKKYSGGHILYVSDGALTIDSYISEEIKGISYGVKYSTSKVKP